MKFKKFSLEDLTEPPSIPSFNEPGKCSGYATRAAKQLFGLTYLREDAWNLRYRNKVPQNSNNGEINVRIIRPGSILGLEYPDSRENTEGRKNRDMRGNVRLYTHIGLYLGQSPTDDQLILHSFTKGPVIESLQGFLETNGSTLKEVLWPRIWLSRQASRIPKVFSKKSQ